MLRAVLRGGSIRSAAAGLVALRSAGASEARRAFSAEASSEVVLPVSLHGIGGKYASALFVAASQAKTLGPVEQELKQLVEVTKSNAGFDSFLKDPSINKEVRIEAIQKIFGEADFTEITKNFLCVLADQGRLSYLVKIAEAYEDLLKAQRGEVSATVTAPLELSDEDLKEISEALKKRYLKPGQNLTLQQKINPDIIGGLVIDIGELHLDMSIDSQIKQMEKLLQESV